MKHIIQIAISKGEKYYIAQGVDLPIVTQGKTLDELAGNVKKVSKLYLKGENLNEFNIAPDPAVLINFELPLRLHV
ncbi:MAG: hypothetical protein A3C71_00915 [Candidatus Yanofskybacteria bacterium RIFCSPHIGHO2_02_FULL_43_15c]|uniref:DUF1902 domain-containing protein n=1 Tax=Candidatus Yanofskybacteria bacterium RIFCSPHIGHO2_02_FULL_43_15c TaxID=1802679 RepID=A0A1F8FDX9_9BACT|nr:MAG: hypothetical protein A3C71_00915 [Candidatus Yanofskybacteria bacterium RIFCSPHIGHO2_02_FULL_43_15c]